VLQLLLHSRGPLLEEPGERAIEVHARLAACDVLLEAELEGEALVRLHLL